jgi:hypothetical protein
MPELVRGEWEHLFEPWFAHDERRPSATAVVEREPESIFREASQPLAVRRKDYVRRQSPVSRSLEERTAHVAEAIDQLVAFAERRHAGVETIGQARGESALPPETVRRRRASSHAVPAPAAAQDAAMSEPGTADGARLVPSRVLAPFRALLVVCSIAAIAIYVVYVQRSAAMAVSRATAAERAATEVQRTAQDAVIAAADRAQRAVADALTQATRAERMIEVIAAPDARRIELSGRTLAPGAVGQALYSRSRGVILSATDMPRPPAGQVFGVWATTPTGSIRLGVATPDPRGRVAAAYELPTDLAGSIRSFVVTQEPEAGSAGPGEPVLAIR